MIEIESIQSIGATSSARLGVRGALGALLLCFVSPPALASRASAETDIPVRVFSYRCSNPKLTRTSGGVLSRATADGWVVVTAAGGVVSDEGKDSCARIFLEGSVEVPGRLMRQDWASGLAAISVSRRDLRSAPEFPRPRLSPFENQRPSTDDRVAYIYEINAGAHVLDVVITNNRSSRHSIPKLDKAIEAKSRPLASAYQGAGVYDGSGGNHLLGIVSSERLVSKAPGKPAEPEFWMPGDGGTTRFNILPKSFIDQWLGDNHSGETMWLKDADLTLGKVTWKIGGFEVTDDVTLTRGTQVAIGGPEPGGIGGGARFENPKLRVARGAAPTTTPARTLFERRSAQWLEAGARGIDTVVFERESGDSLRLRHFASSAGFLRLLMDPAAIVIVPSEENAPAKQLQLMTIKLKKEMDDLVAGDEGEPLVEQTLFASLILQSSERALWTKRDFSRLRAADTAAAWQSLRDVDAALVAQIIEMLTELAR